MKRWIGVVSLAMFMLLAGAYAQISQPAMSVRSYDDVPVNDIADASTSAHPAPFPVELAERLIRMFSFVGDTVLDPFAGTASTQVAAAATGRNSVGIEVDPVYKKMALSRLRSETGDLLKQVQVSDGELQQTTALSA